MKIMVFCEDNSSFEFTSVMVYPYTDHNASDENKYQIRVSHGTTFANSRQDYDIFKCRDKAFRDRVHETLNLEVMIKILRAKGGEITAIVLSRIVGTLMSQNKETGP